MEAESTLAQVLKRDLIERIEDRHWDSEERLYEMSLEMVMSQNPGRKMMRKKVGLIPPI